MMAIPLRIRWLYQVVLNSTHRVVLNSTHKAPCECQTALISSSAKQHSLYRRFLPRRSQSMAPGNAHGVIRSERTARLTTGTNEPTHPSLDRVAMLPAVDVTKLAAWWRQPPPNKAQIRLYYRTNPHTRARLPQLIPQNTCLITPSEHIHECYEPTRRLHVINA